MIILMELKAKAIAVSSLNLLLCLLAFGSEDDVIRIDLSSDVGEVLKVKTGTTSTFVMTLRVAPESDIDLTALLLENNQQPPVWLECPGYLNDSCDSLSIEKGTKKLEFRIIAFPTDIDNEKITLFEPVKLTVRSLVPKSKLQGGDLRVLVIDKRRVVVGFTNDTYSVYNNTMATLHVAFHNDTYKILGGLKMVVNLMAQGEGQSRRWVIFIKENSTETSVNLTLPKPGVTYTAKLSLSSQEYSRNVDLSRFVIKLFPSPVEAQKAHFADLATEIKEISTNISSLSAAWGALASTKMDKIVQSDKFSHLEVEVDKIKTELMKLKSAVTDGFPVVRNYLTTVPPTTGTLTTDTSTIGTPTTDTPTTVTDTPITDTPTTDAPTTETPTTETPTQPTTAATPPYCNESCDPNANCTSTDKKVFICICDGETCIDIDECQGNATNKCGSSARCINTPGSFTCKQCGNGTTCEDTTKPSTFPSTSEAPSSLEPAIDEVDSTAATTVSGDGDSPVYLLAFAGFAVLLVIGVVGYILYSHQEKVKGYVGKICHREATSNAKSVRPHGKSKRGRGKYTPLPSSVHDTVMHQD